MKRLGAAALLLGVAAGCTQAPPSILVHVSAPASLPSLCVVVELTAPAHAAFDQVVTRKAGQDELNVAVFRGDWPATISVEAFIPTACGAPFVRLAHSPVQDATFAPSARLDLRVPDPAPVALAFVGALGQVGAATCSPPLQLEVDDGQGAPALISTPVTASFRQQPDIGLQVFADDACATPVGPVTVGPAPSVTLHVRGLQARPTVLFADAPGLTSAQTPVDVVGGAPAALAVLSPAQTLLAGDCSAPVVIQLQDSAGNPTAAPADLPLAVSLSAAGTGWYSDALCTAPLGPISIPAGSSQQSVSFRPYTPGAATLSADAGALATAQPETVVPIVRRGTCTLPASVVNVQCPVAPAPLQRGRAFAFFQATNPTSSPSDAQVRCALANPPTTLNCFRAGTGGDVTIQWNVVELAYAQVQHLTLDCANPTGVTPYPPAQLLIPRPVNLGQAFLLYSVASIGGNYADDFRAAHFDDAGTSVLFDNALSDCIPKWVYSAEVVELANAQVDRGLASTDAGTVTVGGLSPVDRTRSFLVYSWSTAAGGDVICDRMVMGELSSDTSVQFSLGNGNAACAPQPTTVAWERVQLQYGIVQSPTVSMGAGALTATTGLSPAVNLARTAVFAGGQAVGGQGDGQSGYTADDLAVEGIARHSLNGSAQLQLSRDSADAGAQWRPYVVEFQP